MTHEAYADTSVRRYLELVSAGTPAPGGGSVAALTVAMAAALVAMAARCSSRTAADLRPLAAAADELMESAAKLADDDAEAYSLVIAVKAGRHAADASSDERFRDAMRRAAEVPLEVTAAAAQTARLGAKLSADVRRALVGDLVTAMQLASAAARAAADLVVLNVRAGKCDEDLIRQAHRNAEAAQEALRATSRIAVPA